MSSKEVAITNYSGLAPVNNTHLYYEIWGQGKPLLLVHGHSLDTRMWEPQIPILSQYFQVISLDLRGYGRSDLPTMAPFRYAEDIKGLLEQLGIDKAHCVGLSLGGNVALDFALSYPQKIDHLVLADSSLSGFPPFPGVAESLQAVFDKATEVGIQAAKSLWLAHPLFTPALEQPTVARLLRTMVQEYSGWHWINRYSPSRPIDPTLIERLEQVGIPTLVLTGERDTPQNQAIAALLTQRIPKVQQEVIPGAGHMVNLEAPETFNRVVLASLLGQ